MSILGPGPESRLEPTPGWKGNPPGQYDPLPGQASTNRNREGLLRRLLTKLRGR